MATTITLREQSELACDLDGIEGEKERTREWNHHRTVRDMGGTVPDVEPGTGRAALYGRNAACQTRIASIAYKAHRSRDMVALLGRWLSERPFDPTADRPVGKTYTPPSRTESIVQRVDMGEAVTLTLELRRDPERSGLLWAFVLSEPPAASELAQAARMVRDEMRGEVRASIVLPVSDLIRPILDKMDAE